MFKKKGKCDVRKILLTMQREERLALSAHAAQVAFLRLNQIKKFPAGRAEKIPTPSAAL